MRRKRRSRKNVFWGRPRLHAKAARKGWRKRRSSRRTRRNAGTMSIVHQTTRSLKAGFGAKTLERAGTILAGNVGASFFFEHLARFAPVKSNMFFEVASLLGIAGLQGLVVKKFIPKMLNANDILIGGILAGVTRGVKAILPGSFTTCGLGEDLEGYEYVNGMGSYYASPDNFVINTNGMHQGPLNRPGRYHHGPMHGMGAFARPDQPMIGTHGIGDHATGLPAGQVLAHGHQQRLITLDGLANEEVGREIAMQM